MVTQTQAPDPSQTRTIQIPATAVLPQIQPTIAVGELLRLVVRDNQDGKGLLYFKGLLVPAQLPPDLAPGEKVLAKVAAQGEQLVLRLLEREAPPSPLTTSVPASATKIVEERIKEFLTRSGPLGLTTPPPLELPGASPDLPQESASLLERSIAHLLTSLPSSEELSDADGAHRQLLASATGALAGSLQESARAIRALSPGGAEQDPTVRFIIQLRAHLTELLSRPGDRPATDAEVKKLLDLVDEIVDEQVKKGRGAHPRTVGLQGALDEIRTANADPSVQRQSLTEARSTIESLLPSLAELPPPGDLKTSSELQQIAQRLEQMAATQEKLSQLNPLMQALGEPALILFPFLSQGLLHHSEVTVDPRNGRGKKQGQEEGLQRSAKNTPYQRVQVSVPLPTIGTVDVDMAHRDDEILVRFTVADPEVGAFLLEQLEHLATVLREQNYAKAELVAQVGHVGDKVPSWTAQLRASTSIFV